MKSPSTSGRVGVGSGEVGWGQIIRLQSQFYQTAKFSILRTAPSGCNICSPGRRNPSPDGLRHPGKTKTDEHRPRSKPRKSADNASDGTDCPFNIEPFQINCILPIQIPANWKSPLSSPWKNIPLTVKNPFQCLVTLHFPSLHLLWRGQGRQGIGGGEGRGEVEWGQVRSPIFKLALWHISSLAHSLHSLILHFLIPSFFIPSFLFPKFATIIKINIDGTLYPA